MTVRAIVDEARKLSLSEQADLLDELLALVNPDDAPLTPEQAADLDRRIEESRAGKAQIVPGDVAFERLRKRD